MSGNFIVKEAGDEFPKHAHLRFESKDGAALAFVDPRRFGSWQVRDDWGDDGDRGADIMTEYNLFVKVS